MAESDLEGLNKKKWSELSFKARLKHLYLMPARFGHPYEGYGLTAVVIFVSGLLAMLILQEWILPLVILLFLPLLGLLFALLKK